jgi:WD40 repeat protein
VYRPGVDPGATPHSQPPDVEVGEHYEAFVSYSHVDRARAVALKDGLRERGLDLWMDEAELHSGVWNEQLETAIEISDTFVFLLSPDSAVSAECGRELAHAIHLSKRILPVPIRDTPVAALPSGLAAYQFIPSRGVFDDDAAASFIQLVTEITTDREWVREHTDWTEKAREWERHSREPSYLLAGAELEAAERWRSSSAGKQPALSALHNAFIDASRTAATRRLRRTRAAVGVALVVAIALSILALISRQAAVNSQHQASSGAFAALSVLQLGADPQLSLLLAVRAAQSSRTAAALDALRRAVPANHLIRTFAIGGDDRPLDSAQWSSDEKYVLTASEDGFARLWNAQTGAVVRSFPIGTDREGAVLSRDGREVVTWSPAAIHVWSHTATTPSATITSDKFAQLTAVALSPDGRTIATASGPGAGGADIVWSARTGALLRTLATSTDPDVGMDIAFSHDGTMVAVGGNGGTAAVWQVGDGTRLGRYLVPNVKVSPDLASVTSVAFDPGDTRLLAGSGDPPFAVNTGVAEQSQIWDLRTGRLISAVNGTDPAWSEHGGYVLTTSSDGTARVWVAASGRVVAQMKAGYPITRQGVFGPDAINPQNQLDVSHIATGSDSGSAAVWDAISGNLVSTFAGDTGSVTPAAFSADGRRVLTYSRDGQARIWGTGVAVPTPRPFPTRIKRAVNLGSLLNAGFDLPRDPTAAVVAIQVGDKALPGVAAANVVAILDAQTGQTLGIAPRTVVNEAAFDARGRLMLLMGAHDFAGPALAAQLRLVHGGHLLRTLAGPGAQAVAGALSPDGKLIATVDSGDRIAVWDAASGRRIALFTEHAGHRTQGFRADLWLRFSPDGALILSSDATGAGFVWNARTGRVLNRIDSVPAPATMPGPRNVAISADDRYAATAASWDNAAHVYRVGRAKELLSLSGGPNGVDDVAFNRDDLIATISEDGVRLWDNREPSPIEILTAPVGGFGTGVGFSQDGQTLDISDFDFGASTLPCTICGGFPRLLAEARKLETRGFTQEERDLYLGG